MRRGWGGQRLAFLPQQLRKLFHRARDHQPRVWQIESLRDGSGEIESFRYRHFTACARQIECYMIAEHTSIMLQ